MMGSPDVLMLDEPSAGIDPAARSNMVDILKQVKQEPGARRCIVLTTHLMEEAEALCDRVGIMVNGKLEAVGSLTHLKSRFGKFWQIFVAQTESSSAAAAGGGREKLGEFMRSLHPDAKVLESHLASSMWRVPADGGLTLAGAFRRFEAAKERMGIFEYSVSQSSLEQIFIKFAKAQVGEDQ